ncbi:MAG TPA: hypothetical protein EYG70_02505 [Sulfurimonas sp.]|nr:hypothetical protein [Sulfurimonas sp.]
MRCLISFIKISFSLGSLDATKRVSVTSAFSFIFFSPFSLYRYSHLSKKYMNINAALRLLPSLNPDYAIEILLNYKNL